MTVTGTELYSFGELLKAFRTRRHLTQQHLAEAIGVHRSAIVRWEQGDFLPQSKTLVLEVARHLHLDEQESRHLLEASLTALSPYWCVPLPRNPFFTGRENILEALHTQLGVEQGVALTPSSALHGLGGVGKTQIVLEYAYRHALEYSAVFWIGAETEESIVSTLLRIAGVLQLPKQDEKEQDMVAAVQRWLATHKQWLLIWDNLEDLTLLDRFLPSARQGAVLVTTRCQVLGTFARGVDLPPMELEEGTLFLLRRAKVLFPEATCEQMRQFAERVPAQYTAAAGLVDAMGGLPLALDQAGAYLEATRCGLPAYLELFRARRAALLQQRGEGVRDHPAPVSTTFALAIAATTQRHPAVGDVLRVCALLQPDAIAEELFRQGGEHLGATLSTVCGDVLEWDRVVAIACSYSLLSRQPEARTLSVHRLVQAVLVDSMTKAEQEQWAWRAIRALDATFPEVTPGSAEEIWKQCERLLPHVLAVAATISDQIADLHVAHVLRCAADYLRGRVHHEQAEALYQRVLRIHERALGSEPLEVASSLRGLAILCEEQEKYEQAEALYQQALCIREQMLGTRHPQVANLIDDLGILSAQQGKYKQAEPLFQQALHIREQAHGPDHLEVTKSLYNLAELHREQGNYTQAEPLFERALHIQQQIFGLKHLRVAYTLSGLADLYRQQGKYEQGEALFEQALSIREQILGSEHPQVAYPLNGLAALYMEQGKYEQAELTYMRVLRIREQTLGSDHLETARSLAGLASLYEKQGQAGQAESLLQRVCLIFERHLGETHPETAQARDNYRGLLNQKKEARRALMKEQQASMSSLQESTSQTHSSLDMLSREVPVIAAQEDEPLTNFLATCCELHPLAWCRISDLWQTYEQWMASCQGRVPLSRRVFAAQMKARGCRGDRTSTARIWRGIRLKHKNL